MHKYSVDDILKGQKNYYYEQTFEEMKYNAARISTLDFSYVMGLVFMMSVIGLVVYANFHYNIKMFIKNSLIQASKYRVCCCLHLILVFPESSVNDTIKNKVHEYILDEYPMAEINENQFDSIYVV